MFLTELYSRSDDNPDYRDDSEDSSKAFKGDTRKTRLTLAHINKLRRMNDARTVEQEQKIKQVQQQYKAPSGDESGGMGL